MLLLLLSNQQPTTQIVYSGVVGGAPIGVLPVGSLSVSAVSVAAINANLVGTLADATAVAVANSTNAAISANLAATLGSVTLVATARPFANAVLGVTLGNLVVQSSASVPTSVNGNLNATLGQLTVSAAATTPIAGQLNSVLGPVASSSSARVVASATLSSVLGQTTLASSANTVTPNNASVNATLGQLTVQSASTVRSFGTLTTTLSPALLNSTANVVVRAQLNRSLESTRLFATSTVYNDPPRFATLNSTLGSLTSVITTKVEPFDPFKLLNFFDVELLTQIDAFATEIEISPEYLAAFDTVNYRYALILTDGLSDPEIVWVLGKTNKLFVLRGQEGSVARNWLAGTRVVNGLTAESLSAAAVVGGGGGDGSALNAAVASAVAASASASASAAVAVSSAASASASATSASSSASLTISLASAASVSADNAASSASASFVSATNASSSATSAAASATASQTSRLAAEATTVTALGYMNGAELAAAGAAVSSANATIAKNDAVTARTGALTAEASAISAKDLAVAAKVASETAAGNSLSSAGASASSATAASASATSSQSSATASETSRLAAEAAQTGANTSAANAEIARVDAVTAKTDAQAASASATTSASLSATSATSAGNSATAAATSASSASTSATSAGSSASSATTSANTASVQAGNAAASASAAATSAALADSLTGALAIRTTTLEAQMANTSDSGLRARISTEEVARANADTALASRNTTLEAVVRFPTPGAVNKNSSFTTWSGASGTIPEDWLNWAGTGTINTKVVGDTSPFAYRQAKTAGISANWGIYQNLPNILTQGWYVIEADIRLNSGVLTGAGVYIQYGVSGITSSTSVGFWSEPDVNGTIHGAGTAGQRYRFAKLVQLVNTANFAELYAMTSWDGFGEIASSNLKDITWHKCSIRPASDSEIELRVARGGAASVGARISTEESTRASADAALATRSTTLEAQMANTSASGLQSRISTEETARASADSALATRATTLEAQMANTATSGLQSRIATEESTRASADATQASQITTLTAQANGNPNLFPYPTPIANRTPSQLGWIGTPITSTFSSGVGGLVYYKARPSGGSAVNEAYQFDLPETMSFSTGQQFTFSCYGYAGAATVGDRVYAFLEFRSADNLTSLYLSPSMTLNSGGTRTSVTGIFPGSSTNGRLRVVFIREWPSSGSYQDVAFNMIKVECGPTMTAFTNSAQVIVQSNAIATLNDSAAFWQVLVAASGGDPAIVRLFSGLGGSEISLAAKVLSLINTVSGVAMPVMRAIGGEAYFSRPISSDFGTRRVTIGPGYGVVGSEVVLWFGPSSIAPALQSRTNCIFALGTDGIVYYGGQGLESGSMQGTLNLYDVNLTRLGAGSTNQSMTATGFAPGTITYLWTLHSGDDVNIGSPSSATTNIGHTLALGQSKFSVVKCTMTSSAGPSTFRLLNISSAEMA